MFGKPSVPAFFVVGTLVDLDGLPIKSGVRSRGRSVISREVHPARTLLRNTHFRSFAVPLDILWISLYIGRCRFAPFSTHICPLFRCPFVVRKGCRIAPFSGRFVWCFCRFRAVMAGRFRPLRADHRHHVVAAQKEDFRPIPAPAPFGPDQPSRRRQIAQGALDGIDRRCKGIGKRVGAGRAMRRLMVRKLCCENMGKKPGHRRQIRVTRDRFEPSPAGAVPVAVLIDTPCSGGGVGVLLRLKLICFDICPGCARQRAGVFVFGTAKTVGQMPNFAIVFNGAFRGGWTGQVP